MRLLFRIIQEVISPSAKTIIIVVLICSVIGISSAFFLKGEEKEIAENIVEALIERETGVSVDFDALTNGGPFVNADMGCHN